ncbi:MAG TPA: hypothetical protein OIM14_09115 [Oscillospiraceae bacterium]|nr:hypothetical protein [Oscillospiraceae bacterium]
MLTLREEILNLLESPELLEYLLSNPERLCEFDYANIIAGAPIGLAEKRALLEKLKNSAELRREPDKVADYIAALDSATAALENSGNETVLSVVLRRCGVDSFVDGAYYAASAESARRAIREYVSECSDCDWGHMYWEMKLYRRSDASESGGFESAGAVSPGRYFENRLFAVYGRRALLHIDRGWRRLLRRSVHVSCF